MSRFRMGDHEFLNPAESAPLDRQGDRTPIRGAIPPRWLRGCLVPADDAGPARFLVTGTFCGHGEPTFSVFDLLIDDCRELELAIIDTSERRRVLARPAGSTSQWTVLHDSDWFECSGGATMLPGERCTVRSDEVMPYADETGPLRFRLAVGYEYPVDCQSENEVSWIAIAGECLDDGGAGICLDEELG